MRTSRSIFLLTVINFVLTFVFLKYLPDQVLFGLTGNFYASEFVSKWTNIIIPSCQIIACGIIFLVDVFHRDVPHKYRYLTAYVAFAFTTYAMWILMFMQMNNSEIGVPLDWPWTIIILFPIGLFLLAEGFDEIFYKPMSEFSIFGFSWVRKSPIVWEKTHKCSGTCCILTGLILIVLAVLNELIWHTLWIYLVALLVWLCLYILFTILYAYCIAVNNGTR